MFEEADFLQGLEIFDHEFEGNGAVFGGDGVADFLGVAFAVGEIENFVGVFFAAAPEALVIEEFGSRDAGGLGVVGEIVVAENG